MDRALTLFLAELLELKLRCSLDNAYLCPVVTLLADGTLEPDIFTLGPFGHYSVS